MLKSTLIIALAIASALATEDGYYHKQYQYKSSSSSYKNNELQHKTDDEEFSSIHGDLAGRQDPKVDQYSEHTEYKNPNAQTEDTHGTNFGTGAYQSNRGSSGLESSSALRGSTGYTGTSGYHGSSGYTGSAGYQGSSGYHGSTGVQGSTGLHGSSGYRGSTGVQGSTGYQGITGQQGSAGYQGITGQQGSTGYQGLTGQQGNAGYERRSSYERSSSYQGSASTQQNANQYPYVQTPTSQQSITGQRNSNAYAGTYHTAGSTQLNRGQYDTQSNLYDISQRLQADLSRQLTEALTRRNTYGSTRETEMQALESELRTNVTRQLQEELQRQYGSQTRRGGYSYPQSTGHYQPQANYNTQELDDYTQQVQTNLLDQLKDEYKTSSSYSSQSSYNQKSGYAGTYRPYVRSTTPKPEPVIRPSTPLLDLTTQVQHDLDTALNARLRELQILYFNDNTYKSRNQPDFDVILENLLSEIRRNLTTEMEYALRNTYGIQEEQDGYFFSTWNVNANVANYKKDRLDDLKTQVENGLVKKITDSIKDQKTRYYEERRTYQSRQSYSASQTYESRPTQPVVYPGNQYSSSHSSESSSNSFAHQRPVDQPSYNRRDDYNSQSQHGTSYVHSGIRPNSTPRTNRGDQQQVEEFDYQYSPTAEQRPVGGYKPNSDSLTQGVYSQPAGNAYRSQSTNSESSYQYLSGQSQTGMEYTPSASTRQVTTQELANIRNELSEDLSQQVRNAIWDQQHQSGYTSSSRQPASTQVVNDLSEEFKRNFSRKVEDVLKQHGVRGGYSFSVTTSGNLQNGQNNQRLLELTNKLQDDLLRQLREGLTQQSSTSVHTSGYGTNQKSYGGRYTASSGFREVDYASDAAQHTEDCMQSDEASQKVLPPIIEANPELHEITNPIADLTQTNMEMTRRLEDQQSIYNQNQEDLSQNYDNFDQQTSLVDFPEQSSADLNQQTEDLTQQTENFDASDLNQRSEDFNQRTEVFGPNTADLNKLAHSQNQEVQSFHRSTENVDDAVQKIEKLSSLYSENTSQSRQPTHYSPHIHEPVAVSGLDDIDELQQKTADYLQIPENMDSYQSQSFPLFSAQPIQVTKKPQTTEANDFDSQKMEDLIFQQHIAVEDELKTEIADDYVQKHTPHYHASVVQDVTHQKQKFHSPVFENAESEEMAENLQQQTVHELENNNTAKVTTESPEVTSKNGFWSKLGGKISDSLKKAKDKVQAIG